MYDQAIFAVYNGLSPARPPHGSPARAHQVKPLLSLLSYGQVEPSALALCAVVHFDAVVRNRLHGGTTRESSKAGNNKRGAVGISHDAPPFLPLA